MYLRASQMVFIVPVHFGHAVVVHVDQLVAEDRDYLRQVCTLLRAENHLIVEKIIAMK